MNKYEFCLVDSHIIYNKELECMVCEDENCPKTIFKNDLEVSNDN